MSDIVERLLTDAESHYEVAYSADMRPEDTLNWEHGQNCQEAADEITALRAEVSNLRGTARLHKEWVDVFIARVDELKKALERIDRIEVYYEDARETLRAKLGVMRDIARAALEEKQ